MNIQEMAAAQAEQEDFSVATKGGDFKKTFPEKGKCLVRFREYVELGLRETKTKQYPDKKPAPKARFTFELSLPKHQFTIKDEEGNETFRPMSMSITCPISKSDKSNYFKLFTMLNHAGTAKVPAQLLGNGYMAEIFHVLDDKGEVQYSNFNAGISYGDYSFCPPRTEDPLAGTVTEIEVPALVDPLKLFLWNSPNKQCWDSLFIDGTYTKEVDGVEISTSKNWIQEMLLEALDYEGSKLYELLVGEGETLDDLPTEEEAAAPEQKETTASVQDDLSNILGA